MDLALNHLLAAFINPALFGAGLAAASVPIIIHLLARRRFRRIRWAAMDFLMDAERRNRRRVRIEELILLALRCLAVGLIGALLSRPFVKPTGVAAILGGGDRAERIFVIDDSFSMGYAADDGIIFDRAKAGVNRLLTRIREFAPHDTVTVMATSSLESPIAIGAILDADQMEQIKARLEALQPSQRNLSASRVIDAVAGVLEDNRDVLNATVYLVSDFQRADWSSATSDQKNVSLAAPLTDWQQADRNVRVVLVDVGDDDADNRALTDLNPLKSKIITGVETPVEVTTANYSSRTQSALELEVTVGQSPAASARVNDLAAGRTATVTLPVVFPIVGDAQVRVEAQPDQLPIDDRRFMAVQVSDSIQILLVNGEQSADPYGDEVHLLRTALRPEGDVFSGNTVTVIADTDLETVKLSEFDVVALCNVYRVSESAAEQLHGFVRQGGGLAIFLGDQVSDPETYNAVLYRDGKGLLPAAIMHEVRAPNPGVTLAASDFLHPVVRIFSGSDNPFVGRIRFRQFFLCEPAVSDDRAEPGQDRNQARRRSTSIIARFDDGEMTPALMERPLGKGRVILSAAACDLEGNDWGRDPSYVVAMLEMVQYLARSSGEDRSLVVGEPITIPIDPSVYEPKVVIRPPGYPQQRETEIAAVADDEGGMTAQWDHTHHAGVYTAILTKRGGSLVPRRFAINVDSGESDLTPAAEDELRASLSGVEIAYIAGVPEAEDANDEGRREIWPAMLIFALVILMIEQFLAWRFGRSQVSTKTVNQLRPQS